MDETGEYKCNLQDSRNLLRFLARRMSPFSNRSFLRWTPKGSRRTPTAGRGGSWGRDEEGFQALRSWAALLKSPFHQASVTGESWHDLTQVGCCSKTTSCGLLTIISLPGLPRTARA